jgi:DNA-binding MarR family transcriptional regulator
MQASSASNNLPTTGADSKAALRTWLRLLSCEAVIEQRLRSQFREKFQVTLPQFDVLSELERAEEPLTMSQLSSDLMVSNGNVTGVVDRLVKSGLVKRMRSRRDRRVQNIRLTKEGAEHFRKMARWHEQLVSEIFSSMSSAELEKLQELLIRARMSAMESPVSDKY